MKKEIVDIPEVNLSDVKEFWVLGSQYKDGILGEYNLKMDVKKALAGENNDEEDSENDVFLDLSSLTVPVRNHNSPFSGSLAEEAYSKAQALNLQIGDSVIVKEPSGNQYYTVELIPGVSENYPTSYGLTNGNYRILLSDQTDNEYTGTWNFVPNDPIES